MPKRLGTELGKLGYMCVFAFGFGDETPIKITIASKPAERFSQMQIYHWMHLKVHFLVWTAGKPAAERVQRGANALLLASHRELENGWFDVPVRFVAEAIRIAAEKANIRTFSHQEMLNRCRQMERREFDRLLREEKSGDFRLTGDPIRGKNSPSSPEASAYASIEGVQPYLPTDPRRKLNNKRKRYRGGTRHKPDRDHPYR